MAKRGVDGVRDNDLKGGGSNIAQNFWRYCSDFVAELSDGAWLA